MEKPGWQKQFFVKIKIFEINVFLLQRATLKKVF
jgi:hypothetical protein